MVIKGRIRGHGGQLASYLLTTGQNEQVRILDVDGMASFTDWDLRTLLRDFSLNEQLTKSQQGLYHASINPPEDSSRELSDEDWFKAVNILAGELGFEEQRRAIVLHKKHGRVHAHIAFERYSIESKKMLEIGHNYRKHDKARAKMEQLFKEQPTPKRNPNRDDMKKALTALWKETADAASFISKARAQGYGIAGGIARTPFMVVDESGRSFNLVRHLDGIQLKEARQRFKDTVLQGEKDAIAFVRTSQAVTGSRLRKQAAEQIEAVPEPNETENKPGKEKSLREAFAENLQKQRQQQQMRSKGPRLR